MRSSDLASLGISIDSSDTVAATTALDKLTVAGKASADAADKLAVSGAKSETVLRAIQAAADRSGISFDEMNKRVDDAGMSNTKAATATTAHAAALGKLPGAAAGA